ncbi:MAG: D-tyrosyl-tRNA(Tyr) deacylase [Bacteroidetes bacterium]|nr:D-tyrosyl-tRNA(Tyr) deacylase [Bacteroidota bacterium]
MRIVIQRVNRAAVRVEGKTVGEIGKGLLLLVGIRESDNLEVAEICADKCTNLRIFEDQDGKMNRSLLETGGSILAVSQFTLYGDVRKGRRPSFLEAARPEKAEPLYDHFISHLRGQGMHVETGIFGAMMEVEIQNWGPVTILLES